MCDEKKEKMTHTKHFGGRKNFISPDHKIVETISMSFGSTVLHTMKVAIYLSSKQVNAWVAIN